MARPKTDPPTTLPPNPKPPCHAYDAAALRAFEQDIAETFNRGEIRSPIHLSSGNEDHLIRYFAEHFRPGDWVCSAWRSHLHALLAGVPPDEVRQKILAGRSITLTFPHHNFISSAIVGGILPIAVGIALGLKRCAPRDENIDTSDIPEADEEWFKRAKLRAGLEKAVLTEMNLGNMRYDENGFGRIEEALAHELDQFERAQIRPDRRQRPRVHCFVGDMTARTGAYHEARAYTQGHALPINFIIEDNGKSVGTPTAEVWGTHADPPHEERHVHELKWPHAGSGEWIKF